MTQRDDELDDLEKELAQEPVAKTRKGTPYIERPDTLAIGDGTLCWRDGDRYCGPDCVAHNVDDIDEHGNSLQGPNKCLILLYSGQQASAALSTMDTNKKRLRVIQDAERTAMGGGVPPLPGIGGKP